MIIWRVNFGTGDDAALSGRGLELLARNISSSRKVAACTWVRRPLPLSPPRFAVVDIAICASKRAREERLSCFFADWFVSNNTYAGRWINWIAERVWSKQKKRDSWPGNMKCALSRSRLSLPFSCAWKLCPRNKFPVVKEGSAFVIAADLEKNPP